VHKKLHYKASRVHHRSCVAIPTSSSLAEVSANQTAFAKPGSETRPLRIERIDINRRLSLYKMWERRKQSRKRNVENNKEEKKKQYCDVSVLLCLEHGKSVA